jgi:branched-chain amino acid transport system permease protein
MATLETSRPAAAAPLLAGLSLRAWRTLGLAVLLAGAVVLPFLVSNYRLLQASEVLYYAIAVLGLNMVTGYNGQISLGHGAFFAVGAYTMAILLTNTPIPYWVAIATFALALATPQILKYKAWDEWTGGVQGIGLDKPVAPAFLHLNSDQWLYFLCLAWAVVIFVVGWNLLRGRCGRAMVAIRDHPIAAATMGINTAHYKTLTFGFSAMFTGIAGALAALVTTFVAPDSFQILLSIWFLIAIVVGGVASIVGAIPGAIFLVFVPNFAEDMSKAAPGAIYGAMLIVFVYLMPTGVAGLIRLVGREILRFAASSARR